MYLWQWLMSKRFGMIVWLVLAIGCFFWIGAHPAYASGGSLSGVVTDEEGNPLPNIGVHIYADPMGIDFWGPTGMYGVTNEAGQYTIPDLSPGVYRLSFRDGGWPLTYATEYYNNVLRLEDAANVTVTESQTVTIDAQLTAASRIEGVVTDTQGEPIDSIQVSLWMRDASNPLHWITAGLHATTDSSGAYAFPGVDTGRYRMSFTDTRFPHLYSTEYYTNATLAQATEIVVPGPKVLVIHAQLAGTGQITGMVTDEAGDPLAGIAVRATGDIESDGWNNSLYSRSGTTNAAGTYTITGVDVGSNRLCFSDDTYHYADECYNDAPTIQRAADVTVTADTTVTINAQLTLRGGIRGTVVDTVGNPLPFYQVQLYIDPEDDGTWILDAAYWSLTDTTGAYTLPALNPDVYRVRFIDPSGQFNAPEFYNDSLSVEAATDIVVLPGAITPNINAQMEPFSHITGMVTNAQDQPVENIQVSVYAIVTDTNHLPFQQPLNSTLTAQDGTYNLTGLLPGNYAIGFADVFNNILHPEYYDDAGYLMTADAITIGRAMTVTDINAQLVPLDAVNYPPFATADTTYVLEGGVTKVLHMPWGPEFTVLINDRDAESAPITATLVTSPTYGTVALTADGLFTYTHDGSETTRDFFTYHVFDGVQASNVATVTVIITPIFDLPLALDDAIAVAYGGSATTLLSGETSLLANDKNPEGKPLTATLVTSPTAGTLLLAPNGTFTYTHNGDAVTQDYFSYRAETVGGFISAPATVTVTIKPASSIEFTKTVWIAGLTTPCGITDTLRVPMSTTVAYCYTVHNSGIITLTHHDLVDNQLGVILTSRPYTLTPGATHAVVVTQTLAVTTTNVATWTAATARLTPVQPVTATAVATVTLSTPTDDQDGDGIPDVIELVSDIDRDNLPNFLDPDADGDTVPDQVEVGEDPLTPHDSNADGLADYLDPFVPFRIRLYLPLIAE